MILCSRLLTKPLWTKPLFCWTHTRTHTHTCTHTYTYIYIYICMYVCMYIYIHYIYTRVCVCICTYVYVSVYIHICMHACMYVHLYAHTHTHIPCTYSYTHCVTLRSCTLKRAQPWQTLTGRLVCIFRFIKGYPHMKALSRKGPHVAVCCSVLQCVAV